MIRAFRSLCAKLLSPLLPATEVPEKGFGDKPLLRRRVEVTVERESVSVLLPGQPDERARGTGQGKGGPGAPSAESPPTPSTVSSAIVPASESPPGTGDEKSGGAKSRSQAGQRAR